MYAKVNELRLQEKKIKTRIKQKQKKKKNTESQIVTRTLCYLYLI